MFVKPTQLIGKKEKGIENRTNEEKGEKAKKRRKNRKHPGLTQKRKTEKKETIIGFNYLFIDRCLVGRPIMDPISREVQN